MKVWHWIAWVALLTPACRIDQLETESELASASQALDLLREPQASPPRVRAQLVLSDFVVRHFVALELRVELAAGQSFEGQGLSAEWVEGAEGSLDSEEFNGPLRNHVQLDAPAGALACATGPCGVVLELAPSGSWQSDVPYPLRYTADALLRLERSERLAVAADLDLRLELFP